MGSTYAATEEHMALARAGRPPGPEQEKNDLRKWNTEEENQGQWKTRTPENCQGRQDSTCRAENSILIFTDAFLSFESDL